MNPTPPAPGLRRRHLLLAALPAPALGAQAGDDFDFTDTQGRRHSLARHAGRRVLVNLWATWCTPCLAEMPELQALSREHGDLVVIGLAVDGLLDPARMARFAARLNVTYPLVAGDMEMAATFQARVVPTTLLYDRQGRRILFREGRITRQEIEAVLH